MSEEHKRKGLYERLLEERAEEERRRGRPLGPFYGVDSKVLDRRLADAPKDRPPGYRRDVYELHRFVEKGVHSPGSAMRFHSLKKRYAEEHAELKAEGMGQGELL
ncbi:MAG: hypothetical protein CYG60_20730 [Actinobacteria bacterium]|nr:MAG: hypothetical protein CYG60_20730 [Actinomycetota bacterium]